MIRIGQMLDDSGSKPGAVVSPKTIPKYQSIRATALGYQLDADRLMAEGNFKDAGKLLDQAIRLLNTIPPDHR
jgi:hypothetical protein